MQLEVFGPTLVQLNRLIVQVVLQRFFAWLAPFFPAHAKLGSRIHLQVHLQVVLASLALQVHTAPPVLHLFCVQLVLGRVQYPQSRHPHAAFAILVTASVPAQLQLLLEAFTLSNYT